MFVSHRSLCVVASLTLMVVAGCGGDSNHQTAYASGVITKDGQPVPAGRVIFYPTGAKGNTVGKPARANLESDGTFVLTTYDTNDGAVLGDHNITVLGNSGEGEARAIGIVVPGTVTVKEGENEFVLTLTDMPEPKKCRNTKQRSADLEEPEDEED